MHVFLLDTCIWSYWFDVKNKQHLNVNGLILGFPEKPFIIGKKVSARIDVPSLLRGNLKLANVSIDKLDINMTSDKDGKWNVCWMNEEKSTSISESNSDAHSSSCMQLDISGAVIRNVNFILNDMDNIKVVLKNFDIYSDSFKNLQNSNVKLKHRGQGKYKF